MIQTMAEALSGLSIPVLRPESVPRDAMPVCTLVPRETVTLCRAGGRDYIRSLKTELSVYALTRKEAEQLSFQAEKILCEAPYRMKMLKRTHAFDEKSRVFCVSSEYGAYQYAGRQESWQ